MSQRSIRHSEPECLDSNGDDEQTADQTIKRLKQETAVDLSIKVYVCRGAYHRKRWGIPGCPNADWDMRETTIEEAIERGDDPCKKCNPPDYRESTNGEHPTNEGESR
jgi:hypothetical protein